MRSRSLQRFHPGWLAAWGLVMILLLTGCGGDEKAAGNASNPSGQADVALANEGTSGGGEAAQSAPTDPAQVVVATVNGEPITRAAFDAERARRTVGMELEPATQEAFDEMVLQSLIDQVLIEQYAAQQGIVVAEEEIDAELAAQSQIAAQNNMSFDEFVSSQLYTMDEYREAIRDMLLWNKVSEQVVANVPTTSMQVHSRHILVADEATARDLIAQINQGADFGQLASQYSLDKSSATNGGDLAWVSEGDILQPEVEAVIFSLEPGQMTQQPLHSSLGYHVIEVLERAEGRPLDPAALAERKSRTFLTWLENQRSAATIERLADTAAS